VKYYNLKLNKRAVTLCVVTVFIVGMLGALWLIRDKDTYVTKAPPQLPVPSLKKLAEEKGLQVGSFASLKYLRERAYTDILATQFEYAIVDGEPNWKFEDHELRPSREAYNFDDVDQVFTYAEQNDMPVRVQHLVWGDDKWLPDWLKSGDYTQPELMQILEDHITTFTKRYKGRVREYSVVNEAFSRKLLTGGNHDWWGEHLDQSYIDNAFIWARQGDPDAILILNDFGNETVGDTSNLMYDYIKGAKARGVPIDALGMQMHIDATNTPSREKVVANMKRFNDIGVKVYITEFDVNMHSLEKDRDEEDQIQATTYKELLGACLDVGASNCPNFGFLGLIDRQSWYNGLGITDANPLLFNDDYTPKPAFFAVRDVLTSK
jgi:endo-1,4-beta-xylanase